MPLTRSALSILSVLAEYVCVSAAESLGDVLRYIVTPVLGFISVGAMWLKVEPTSLNSGLIWASIGIAYLAVITSGFRVPAPQYEDTTD